MKKMENLRSEKAITSGLISAVRKGNLEKARELINSVGLSHSEAWSGGYVLLRDALKNKHAAVAKLLLISGSKVNIRSPKPSQTPLHFAVMNGNTGIVKMILDSHAHVDAKDQYGQTPLHVAAGRGYSQIAEHLLDNGANINCADTRRKNYTPLHFAVQGGSTEVVTLLLNRGANVDAKGEDSITPLHMTAQKIYGDRYIRIAEDLLNHGACIHSTTLKERYTPLHFASELLYGRTVKLFLDRGADVHARTKDDSTPLHIATRGDRDESVKLLLQHGAKVDDQDKDGKTILLIAVEKQNLTIVEDILKYYPDIDNQSNRRSLKIAVQVYGERSEKIGEALLKYGFIVDPKNANDPELLHAAVGKGYLKIVEDLLKYGTDVNALHDSSVKEGFTPLHVAAMSKQEEVAKLLISHGADVNARDKTRRTPIFYAIFTSDIKITKLLLTNRADIKDSPELLNTAVDKKGIEIVEVLLQYGADIGATDENGKTALHFTASRADVDIFRRRMKPHDINIAGEIAKLLLSKGANVNTETKDGVTTLHTAAEIGYAKVIEALLEYNAIIDCKDKNDSTPLHFSAREGKKDISIMLLDRGANVNAKQKDGVTPLHLAAQENHKEVGKVLLKRGAKVDSRMKNDMTPLHLAAKKGSSEIIEILMKLEADIDSKDEDGRTALHIASEHGHYDVVQFLLDYGSDINITSKNNYTALDYAMDGISSFNKDLEDYDADHYESEDEFYDDFRFIKSLECSHKYIAEILKCHMVKMITADLYVSERNSRLINSHHRVDDFQDEDNFEKEIMSMKRTTFDNRKISFYDILTKDINSLAMYMRIEKIVEVSESRDYARDFPIYASMLENNFRRGIKRRKLLARGNESFHFFSKDLPKLPYDCVERIFSYLSDNDLRNLIDACEPLGISNPNINDNELLNLFP